jgi:hypothetical protein
MESMPGGWMVEPGGRGLSGEVGAWAVLGWGEAEKAGFKALFSVRLTALF